MTKTLIWTYPHLRNANPCVTNFQMRLLSLAHNMVMKEAVLELLWFRSRDQLAD